MKMLTLLLLTITIGCYNTQQTHPKPSATLSITVEAPDTGDRLTVHCERGRGKWYAERYYYRPYTLITHLPGGVNYHTDFVGWITICEHGEYHPSSWHTCGQ